MIQKRKYAVYAWVILICVLLTGCKPLPIDPARQHVATDFQEPKVTLVPISPIAPETQSDERSVMLYFQFANEPYLSTETRVIEATLGEPIEYRIISELIKGPSADHPELGSLIHPNARVLSVDQNEGLLFITLSKEFLFAPYAAPKNWEEDEYWQREVILRRRLALASIVNSISEQGKYSKIQLLVDPDNEGETPPNRVYRSLFYHDVKRDDKVLLDMVGRFEDVILNPSNTIIIAISSLQSKNWEPLYKYIAFRDLNGVLRPSREEFIEAMMSLGISIESYTVGNTQVSNNGQTATVSIKYTYLRKDDSSVIESTLPVKLVREAEVWKLVYPSLVSLMQS